MGIILFLVIYVPTHLIIMCLYVIIYEHYYPDTKKIENKK